MATPVLAQQSGGGPAPVPTDNATAEISRIHADTVAASRRMGLPPIAGLPRSSAAPLTFPLRLKPGARGATGFAISNFVDLDSTSALRDYACGTRTYNGHGGIDLFLWPFSWWKMDRGEMEIVAASPGTIVNKADGRPDRNCSWSGQQANFVVVQQSDGFYAYYYHMKNGSVTTKPVGSAVQRGEVLGLVASSGVSTGPHLHFELRDEVGVVDPFAGSCGASTTLWRHQWFAHRDTRLVEVATHSAPPVFPSCPGAETPNYQNSFSPGQSVYGIVYMRDQFPGNTATIQYYRPDGTLAAQGSTGAPGSGFYAASYWWNIHTLPSNAPAGVWKVRSTLGTQVLEHSFFVSQSAAQASVVASILPTGRSIRNNTTATVFATIANASATAAHGCWIQPETPLDADFAFQTTNPSTNALTGTPNTAVSIPANSFRTFVLGFTPRSANSVSRASDVRLRFKCTNSDGAPLIDTVNILKLSFEATAVPDVIPIAVTPSGDGIVRVPGPTGSSFFAAAAVNIGGSASITVQPVALPGVTANTSICETNSATGTCLSPAAASVTRTFGTNANATFSIFVNGTGTIAPNAASNRIVLRFSDSGGVLRGETSVAVQTGPASDAPAAGAAGDGVMAAAR